MPAQKGENLHLFMTAYIHCWVTKLRRWYKQIFIVDYRKFSNLYTRSRKDAMTTCGVFAIAISTSLAFGEDPSTR